MHLMSYRISGIIPPFQLPILTGLVFLLTSGLLFSDTSFDVRGDVTVNQWSRYGVVTLNQKKVRYESSDPIPLRFRVENRGYQVMRVYPSLEAARSFQFMVLDQSGREIPLRLAMSRIEERQRSTRDVVSMTGERMKEIILHPGETFEKEVYLEDYYELVPGNEYRVTGYFYPDPTHDYFVRTENEVKIRLVHPEKRRAASSTGNQLLEGEISPEESVYLFLSAEMRGNWKNYLKFLELRKYITVYDRFSVRYAAASDQDRVLILDEFASYLKKRPAERLASFRILSGRILRMDPVNGIGSYSVVVEASREKGGRSIRYEYDYTLEKGSQDQPFWKIVRVDARIIN